LETYTGIFGSNNYQHKTWIDEDARRKGSSLEGVTPRFNSKAVRKDCLHNTVGGIKIAL
jgi:hypothetical protein